MFPAADSFLCSPLPSSGCRGRHTFRGPAVPHLHEYYGIVRFLPILRPRSLVALDRQLPLPQISRQGDWEAFPSSWRIPMKACLGLETPAAPGNLA